VIEKKTDGKQWENRINQSR